MVSSNNCPGFLKVFQSYTLHIGFAHFIPVVVPEHFRGNVFVVVVLVSLFSGFFL